MNGDTMSENTLNAFLGETPIGQFRRTNDGSIIFQYHDSYRWSQSPTPISLSMPITAAEYSGDIPRNFLEALVPESPQARDEAMRLHHARSTSAFDLLQAIGFDGTGALRLSADPHLPIDDDSLIPISDSQIANRLRAAAPTGIQSASVDEHWSVAGQQGKIALRNRNGSWFSTTGIARTTHIIKPGIPTLPHQAFNEHITMRIVEAMGIPVAHTSFHIFDGVPAIISERYDRIVSANGTVTAPAPRRLYPSAGHSLIAEIRGTQRPNVQCICGNVAQARSARSGRKQYPSLHRRHPRQLSRRGNRQPRQELLAYCSMARPCGLPALL